MHIKLGRKDQLFNKVKKNVSGNYAVFLINSKYLGRKYRNIEIYVFNN